MKVNIVSHLNFIFILKKQLTYKLQKRYKELLLEKCLLVLKEFFLKQNKGAFNDKIMHIDTQIEQLFFHIDLKLQWIQPASYRTFGSYWGTNGSQFLETRNEFWQIK